MTESPIISRKSALLEAEVDGELVGLHVDNGTCYGFNATATRIWTLLAEPKSLAEICETLLSEFSIEREECERDVVALIRELERDGLVEVQGQLPLS